MPVLAGAVAHLLVLLTLLGVPLPAEAQGLDAAIDRTFDIYRENPGEAADFLARSLAAAEAAGDEDPYLMAEGYLYLGRFQAERDALAEAERSFQRAIVILDPIPEAATSQIKIDAMEEMGMAVGRQQRTYDAVSIFNRVLQRQAQAKSRTHPDRLRSMRYMAITLEAGGSWRGAEFYRRTVLGIALDTGMAEDEVAFFRESLARNLDNQGRNEEAERIRAGEPVIDVEGAILAELEKGEALHRQERREEAHAQFQRIRTDFAATAGDSTFYMLALRDIAETGDPGDHRTQAALYEEAIAISDRLYGLEPPGNGNGELHYLAAREWAFHGDFDRAFKGFDDLDGFGGWVGDEVRERQRAVKAIMEAALREPGAEERCRIPVETRNSFEILYAGYVVERTFADLGRNQGRAPALDCALALAGPEAVADTRLAALMALGLALIDTAEYERAIAIQQESLALAESLARPPGEIRLILGGLALAHGWTRRFDEALALVGRAEAIAGAGDLERLSLLRIRAITLINATRYLEAEDVLGETLALADSIPPSDAFDDDRAAALNDLASVLTRAGRTADALAVTERITLPETLPAEASASQTIFYLDIRQTRMKLLFALGRRAEAEATVAAFRDAAIPAADRLLANPERNVILAGSVASTMTTAAVALAGLGLHDEAGEIAEKANALIADDHSEGVRLLAARNELVRAYAALVGGEPELALSGFDRALEAGLAILPAESDEMLEMWAGRGMARLGFARASPERAAGALDDLRRATGIARQRIARESRFDDTGIQRRMRPAFETLVGSAWLAGSPQ